MDFSAESLPKTNVSCCVHGPALQGPALHGPALHGQQPPGPPPPDRPQASAGRSAQTDPRLKTLGANERKSRPWEDPGSRTQEPPPAKRRKASRRWVGKTRRDEEELKEQVGELKERLQTLQEKVWKAVSDDQRTRGQEAEPGGTFSEEGPVAGARPDEAVALQERWSNGARHDGDAHFADFLKLELRGAMARVIDRVLRLYAETPDSGPSTPHATASILDERLLPRANEEERQRSEKNDGNAPQTDPLHPGFFQLSEGVCGKLLPHQLPLLVHPASRPQAPPSCFSAPHLQSLGSLPPLHVSLREHYLGSLSRRPLPASGGFGLSPGGFSGSSRPPLCLPRGPMLLQEPGQGEGRVEVGTSRAGGSMDLYFTAGSQEGLSPCHLKKAKLLFFYTRYPSSSSLKAYFPDVTFNRSVTSQMIKWFSNFREFFYIQMERFARQAVHETLDDGARMTRDRRLRVDHCTELYRVLNTHYNKSNVYQVPDGFIRVSEVALKEFYSAIWTGRDSDPSWKKGIYKTICKLDGPVPEAFLLPGCPVG